MHEFTSPAANFSSCACTGFVYRKCPKRVLGRRMWQKRYLILEPRKQSLAYYNGPTAKSPIGIIPALAIKKVVRTVSESKKNSDVRFAIELIGDWKFEFKAKSKVEKERWLLALRDRHIDNNDPHGVCGGGDKSPSSSSSSSSLQHIIKNIIQHNKQLKYWKPENYLKIQRQIMKEKKRVQKYTDAHDRYNTRQSSKRSEICRNVEALAWSSYAATATAVATKPSSPSPRPQTKLSSPAYKTQKQRGGGGGGGGGG
eukprot:CAMPEP_0167822728 /NCGR_PEP_ID=MMETSP0112_2-20121227/7691_1 /TAXON_ID=91324 /ORGANISM="Lotharella globosa, Strain CCCM811" /LENGTH=255 /DNA_ID=CAMNT_0007724195 /DNA_START=91 /DNA_END=855 /DNA_ORIENTATION=-